MASKDEKTEASPALKMLKCNICLQRYRSPKLLPCFHTFCQRCVEKVAGTKPSVKCPTCRTVSVLPPGGAKDLQANFYIEKDLAENQSYSGEDCELCNKGAQATYKCVECQQVYCTPCRNTHDGIQSCMAHTVLPLTADVGAEGTDEKRCPKHKNQLLLLFCCQCEVSICIQCKLTSHDGHETEDVVDTGKKARADLVKELQSITQQEKVLQAVLDRAVDFEEDLIKEKMKVEEKIQSRSRELKSMITEAEKEALDGVVSTTENAVNDLNKQSAPVKLRHAAVVAKQQHIIQIVEKGDDSEVVAFVAQMKAEADSRQGNKSSKVGEVATVERGTVRHEFKSRAVKYTDVLAFIGLATEGPILESKALTMDADSLQESIKPRPAQSLTSQPAFGKHKMSKDGDSSFVEIIYSKNPKATLQAMHLSSDDMIWINFNPGGSVQHFAQYDDDGKRIEVHSEQIPQGGPLISCEDDTIVSLTNFLWIRPGGESGVIKSISGWAGTFISKSSTPLIFKGGAIYCFASVGFPPQIQPNAVYTVNVNVSSFDVSSDSQFFAFGYGSAVYVYDKLQSSTALRSYSSFTEPKGQAVSDVCFSFLDGVEVLLVACAVLNTVHLVDYKDGCYLIGKLETDQCPLNAPQRLSTNHQGRVWVGCNGGKVVVFDV